MPGAAGFTMDFFAGDQVPAGTKLFTDSKQAEAQQLADTLRAARQNIATWILGRPLDYRADESRELLRQIDAVLWPNLRD